MSNRSVGKKSVTAVLLLALFAASYAFDLPHYLTLDVLHEKQTAIKTYQETHAVTVEVSFFLISVAVATLSIPGAVLLTR